MKFNILHTEWSGGWGGQEIRIFHDLQVLESMGHQTTLMAVPEGMIAEKAEKAGLRVIRQPMRNAFDPTALWKMVSLFRREKFDVVNTHSSVDSWLASAAAKIARTPVLVRTRHLSVPLKTHPFNFVYQWPDGIVTTAEMIRRRMIDVNGMDENRVISIPTGVDLTRFDPGLDPGNLREELGIESGSRIVTMAAVLRSWKRHEVLLEAVGRLVEKHPEVRVLIVGEGPYRPWVEGHVERLGLKDRVIMTGFRTDIPKLLAISDVCALTSESSEGVPQSVLQYQAMARPVVACRAGGIPEVIEDGATGLLAPPNDIDAVASAVSRLLEDKGLAEKLGQNARKVIEEKHSLKTMAETTLDFYDRIYKAKANRGRV